MSILTSFDNQTKAMISAEDVVFPCEVQLDTCIIMWQNKISQELQKLDLVEEVAQIRSGNGPKSIYRVKGTDIAVYESPIGAPMTAGMLENVRIVLGIKNVVAFGICGVLTDIEEGKCILPTAAYRDEGTSYHYCPAEDYIEIKNSKKLAVLFDELNVGYQKGKTWTTDAMYRETMGNRDLRVAEGCIAVDMECSALQAVCNFRGMELYQFFYGADSLNGSKWNARILGNFELSKRMKFFYLALELAKRINEHQ